MSSVGPGVVEIRVHASGEYRVFYIARFKEAVYVLHAFLKRAQRTPAREIALGRKRYGNLLREQERR
jgi:phage-related protein